MLNKTDKFSMKNGDKEFNIFSSNEIILLNKFNFIFLFKILMNSLV